MVQRAINRQQARESPDICCRDLTWGIPIDRDTVHPAVDELKIEPSFPIPIDNAFLGQPHWMTEEGIA